MTAERLNELAADLAAGRRTARELVARAVGVEPYGATERILDEQAAVGANTSDYRRAAGTALSSLDGMPFAVKANIDIAGVPTTSGTALPVSPAAADAAVVGQLRAAGLVPARIATMAELAIGSVTDNPHTGSCHNPAAPGLSAGGSSGGSAALVAAGVVPLALGSDTMGSVRIPAAYCQVAGWKPSRDAVSLDGLVALHPFLDSVGFLAASAADLMAVAALVLATPAPTCTTVPRVAVPSFAADVDSDAGQALHAARADLEARGVPVSDAAIDLDLALVRRRGLLVCEADTYRRFAPAVEADDPGLSERLRGMLRYGRDAGHERVAQALGVLTEASATVGSALAGVDVLLLPATPTGPQPVGTEYARAADLTAWVNVAGLPAVVVPAGARDESGLRRSVQLVGRRGEDLALLAFAAAVEASWC